MGTGVKAWLVGGTVRDLVSGVEPFDIDIATAGDPGEAARGFADSCGGSFFRMSDEFKTCRVISPDRLFSYDFAALRAPDIFNDLRRRDFTVDAMAVDLCGDGELIDPVSGLDDLRLGQLVPCGSTIFVDDPLRLLRAVRLATTRGLAISAGLTRMIRENAHRAGEPSVERRFSELSLILKPPQGGGGIRQMDQLGLLAVILPEIKALQGVTQNRHHHLDVYEHTLANYGELSRIIDDPGNLFPGQAETLAERSSRIIAGDAGWRLVMGLASLLHDIAKPYCREEAADGRIRFLEHHRLGREMADNLLARFKVSISARRTVAFLVGRHMRFEGLVQQQQPSDRARYRYLRATEPFSAELIMLSVSDRLSVRGPLVTEQDVEQHLVLAREMMRLALEEEVAGPPPSIINGDELMRALGLEPGPQVGRLVEHIREEQALGNISTKAEALVAAAGLLNRREEDGESGQ